MTKRLTSLALACLCMLASWAATPFVPTTVTNGQFAADTQWYSLAIGASKLRIADNNGAAAITARRLHQHGLRQGRLHLCHPAAR